jgi:hypothetical protein
LYFWFLAETKLGGSGGEHECRELLEKASMMPYLTRMGLADQRSKNRKLWSRQSFGELGHRVIAVMDHHVYLFGLYVCL